MIFNTTSEIRTAGLALYDPPPLQLAGCRSSGSDLVPYRYSYWYASKSPPNLVFYDDWPPCSRSFQLVAIRLTGETVMTWRCYKKLNVSSCILNEILWREMLDECRHAVSVDLFAQGRPVRLTIPFQDFFFLSLSFQKKNSHVCTSKLFSASNSRWKKTLSSYHTGMYRLVCVGRRHVARCWL